MEDLIKKIRTELYEKYYPISELENYMTNRFTEIFNKYYKYDVIAMVYAYKIDDPFGTHEISMHGTNKLRDNFIKELGRENYCTYGWICNRLVMEDKNIDSIVLFFDMYEKYIDYIKDYVYKKHDKIYRCKSHEMEMMTKKGLNSDVGWWLGRILWTYALVLFHDMALTKYNNRQLINKEILNKNI